MDDQFSSVTHSSLLTWGMQIRADTLGPLHGFILCFTESLNTLYFTFVLKCQRWWQPDWNARAGTLMHIVRDAGTDECSSREACPLKSQRRVQKWTSATHPGENGAHSAVKKWLFSVAPSPTRVSSKFSGRLKKSTQTKIFLKRSTLGFTRDVQIKSGSNCENYLRWNWFYNRIVRESHWSNYEHVDIQEQHYSDGFMTSVCITEKQLIPHHTEI